jgi:hypothetical protein
MPDATVFSGRVLVLSLYVRQRNQTWNLSGEGRTAVSVKGQETQYTYIEIFSISSVISRVNERSMSISGIQGQHEIKDYSRCGCYCVYFIGRFERYSTQIDLFRLLYSELYLSEWNCSYFSKHLLTVANSLDGYYIAHLLFIAWVRLVYMNFRGERKHSKCHI